MPKTMSLKQLAANRHNARQSTGPKTPGGRAASKMNALKHGLLAQSVVVLGHQLKESAQEFKTLCQELYASLAPDGPLEEMLVDQIATATWRLRRARTAESGEIALSVDGGWWQRKDHDSLSDLLDLSPLSGAEGLIAILQRSVRGCRYLLHCLKDVRQAVERDGELTEATLITFKKWLRDQAGNIGDKLDRFRAWRVGNPEKLEPAALRARHREEVLNDLDREIRDLEFLLEQRKEREDTDERSRQSAAVLPSEAALDKILRYEAALERQLFRAMHQLERLQRRRQGENLPAPLNLEISARV